MQLARERRTPVLREKEYCLLGNGVENSSQDRSDVFAGGGSPGGGNDLAPNGTEIFTGHRGGRYYIDNGRRVYMSPR